MHSFSWCHIIQSGSSEFYIWFATYAQCTSISLILPNFFRFFHQKRRFLVWRGRQMRVLQLLNQQNYKLLSGTGAVHYVKWAQPVRLVWISILKGKSTRQSRNHYDILLMSWRGYEGPFWWAEDAQQAGVKSNQGYCNYIIYWMQCIITTTLGSTSRTCFWEIIRTIFIASSWSDGGYISIHATSSA